MPDDPAAWIIRVGRNKAIDRLRRERILAEKRRLLEATRAAAAEEAVDRERRGSCPTIGCG